MTSSVERAFSSLLARLLEVRLSGRDSVSEYLRAAKFGAVQGQLGALEDLGVITWDQVCLLTDLLLSASRHAGEPFPAAANAGPVMPPWVELERKQSVKPSARVSANEPRQVSAPSTPPGLRLLCLLVKGRDGKQRLLPVHTMRPLPPRVGPSGRWSLAGDPSFVLRETHAARPTAQVLARYLPKRHLRPRRSLSVLDQVEA